MAKGPGQTQGVPVYGPAAALRRRLFTLGALLHTFAAPRIARLGHRWPEHAGAWHLPREVAVVVAAAALLLL